MRSKLSSIEKKDLLEDISKNFDSCIKPIEFVILDFDTKNGQKTFSDMNRKALDEGYEGLMIKPINDIYESKRSHAWLKIKPFIEVTLKVTQIQEGTGKHEGKLGAFSVEGEDDGKFFSLSVGSGLTDDDRERFWKAKDSLIGQLIEIRADAITQSMEGEHFS